MQRSAHVVVAVAEGAQRHHDGRPRRRRRHVVDRLARRLADVDGVCRAARPRGEGVRGCAIPSRPTTARPGIGCCRPHGTPSRMPAEGEAPGRRLDRHISACARRQESDAGRAVPRPVAAQPVCRCLSRPDGCGADSRACSSARTTRRTSWRSASRHRISSATSSARTARKCATCTRISIAPSARCSTGSTRSSDGISTWSR